MVGYKPGDVFSKYLNTLGSITSNLEALKEDKRDKYMNGVKILEGYITQGLMEIISIEDILGSSYNNCIILAEEMQLLTKENMEALVSRVGNSRIFLNGDLKQGSRMINKDPREMGLFHLIDVFKDSKLAGHLNLQSIQRSPFVSELAERW
jgi:PhoH-like ATPase